jgi:hypothetical protein
MGVGGRGLQAAMPEQHLDGAQVGAGLQQVGGEAVPQGNTVRDFASLTTDESNSPRGTRLTATIFHKYHNLSIELA